MKYNGTQEKLTEGLKTIRDLSSIWYEDLKNKDFSDSEELDEVATCIAHTLHNYIYYLGLESPK